MPLKICLETILARINSTNAQKQHLQSGWANRLEVAVVVVASLRCCCCCVITVFGNFVQFLKVSVAGRSTALSSL